MKNFLFFSVFLFSSLLVAQTDYSNSWEDFYSYNNVKDFVKVDDVVYALTDNAVFMYDLQTKETDKLSSVNGLSGETTSAIHYNKTMQKLIIGYQNGLIEVVDNKGNITISADIVNFNQSGEKRINDIYEFDAKIYLSTPFAIVMYDIEKLEFGDTYFIGNGSTSEKINQITVFNNKIYVATQNGLFVADKDNANLIDFNNWQQLFTGNNLQQITVFNNQLYVVLNNALHRIDGQNLILIKDFFQPIIALKTSENNLSIALRQEAYVFDVNLLEIQHQTATLPFNYTLNNIFANQETLYLATKEFGLLIANFSSINTFEEAHPTGPLSNDVFSIAVQNQDLWVVYGGYDETYTPSQRRQGFSHYNGETWVNVPFDTANPTGDLVDVAIDPSNSNKVYISSYGDTHQVNTKLTGGLLVVEDNEITQFYNHINSPFGDIAANDPNRVTIRVGSSTFDNQGNLWITNTGVDDKLKKLTPNGQWSSIDLSSIVTLSTILGVNAVVIDKNNSKWIGTRRNGVYIYNENSDRKRALTTEVNNGSLPHANVRALAVDKNNKIWLGTLSGLVTYNNASRVFDDNLAEAKPIIIDYNGEVGERLLGDQTINTIAVDGADNKWFGTDNGGVLYTNPNGQTTIANFNTTNSPLPSNRILKIKVDSSSGKVFFATDKGIVAYNSKVAPFGDVLASVYAYPNPVLKQHQFVTIDGRNGTHLPKGTNVKILDVAGHLVYETNVVEGQQLQGGKVVWNKTNLAGKKVASGVYIVLLTNEDASESSITKIAIVN